MKHPRPRRGGRGPIDGTAAVTVLLLALGAAACGGTERPSHLPPPVYERPELPPWEPEEATDPLDDAVLEGEWVEEPPEEGGDPQPPPAGDASEGVGEPPAAPDDADPPSPSEVPSEVPSQPPPAEP